MFSLFMYACGEQSSKTGNESTGASNPTSQETTEAGKNPTYDPNRGEGKYSNTDIPATLDQAIAASGEKVFDVKCSSCHKTTNERLVGPGWKDVTKSHGADWILNFITSPDAMIDKDPKVQAQLELCLVRMPNQNLTDNDARSLYEFMRKNDGVK